MCVWASVDSILRTRGHESHLIQQAVLSGRAVASLDNLEHFVDIRPVATVSEAVELVTAGTHVVAVVSTPRGRHAVVLVDTGPNGVLYWDCNDSERLHGATLDELRRCWFIGLDVMEPRHETTRPSSPSRLR